MIISLCSSIVPRGLVCCVKKGGVSKPIFETNSKADWLSWFISDNWGWARRRGGPGGGVVDLCFIDGLILNDLSTTCQNLWTLGRAGTDFGQFEFTFKISSSSSGCRQFNINHTSWAGLLVGGSTVGVSSPASSLVITINGLLLSLSLDAPRIDRNGLISSQRWTIGCQSIY